MTRILCVHGLGGTAATMQPLADALCTYGHEISTITLPGHGTVDGDLIGITWHDWVAAVAELCAEQSIEVIIGQSMGGSIALVIAARRGCVAAVIINPPPPDADAIDGLEWRASRGHDALEGPALATLPDGTIEPGYTRIPISALLEMAHGIYATDLGEVSVPVLLVSSEHDDVVDPASAAVIIDGLAGHTEHLVLRDSGHTATLGPEIETLVASIDSFIHRLPA